jgi:hypothetical protein
MATQFQMSGIGWYSGMVIRTVLDRNETDLTIFPQDEEPESGFVG